MKGEQAETLKHEFGVPRDLSLGRLMYARCAA
jgi:hypothetical protein